MAATEAEARLTTDAAQAAHGFKTSLQQQQPASSSDDSDAPTGAVNGEGGEASTVGDAGGGDDDCSGDEYSIHSLDDDADDVYSVSQEVAESSRHDSEANDGAGDACNGGLDASESGEADSNDWHSDSSTKCKPELEVLDAGSLQGPWMSPGYDLSAHTPAERAAAAAEAVSLEAVRESILLVLSDICPSSGRGVRLLTRALETMGARLLEVTEEAARSEDVRASVRSRSESEGAYMSVTARRQGVPWVCVTSGSAAVALPQRLETALGSGIRVRPLTSAPAAQRAAGASGRYGACPQCDFRAWAAVEDGVLSDAYAEREQKAALIWLSQQARPWPVWYCTALCHKAALKGQLAALKFLLSEVCGQALFGAFLWDTSRLNWASREWASASWLDFVAVNQGHTGNFTLADKAAFGGHVEVLQWLHQERGHKRFAALRWLHRAGCPHDVDVLCELSLRNTPEHRCLNPQLMEWLRGIGGSWIREMVSDALIGSLGVRGSEDMIRWLRREGAQWLDLCYIANSDTVDIGALLWAAGQGCPWGGWAPKFCVELSHGRYGIKKAVHEAGCPCQSASSSDDSDAPTGAVNGEGGEASTVGDAGGGDDDCSGDEYSIHSLDDDADDVYSVSQAVAESSRHDSEANDGAGDACNGGLDASESGEADSNDWHSDSSTKCKLEIMMDAQDAKSLQG
ncbi:hypothetical protein JKP88DRAFT_281597 [Tribonema minus]|uniref:Uncharacterized protein n=1 Tax=Tribonema minus TaxID=303371 RepID=A0A836C9U7_9STRA|nr:hypothetical protein JKP88DRAFT_281597 [Tribonema minus]